MNFCAQSGPCCVTVVGGVRQTLVRSALACILMLLAGCSTLGSRDYPAENERAAPDPVRSAEIKTLPTTAAQPAPKEEAASVASRAAAVATSMVGIPYRYGGNAPDGFDCSGLVHYAYRVAGVTVPRVSHGQLRASEPVPVEDARPGDLVFFRLANKISHVGIYLGDYRFVHAPSTGRNVEIQSLRSDYYAHHFIRAGRLAVDP